MDEAHLESRTAELQLEPIERRLNPEPSSFREPDDLPVQNVSWQDVQEFLARLTCHTGRKYRLPTHAEWEHAARGEQAGPYGIGAMISIEVANFDCTRSAVHARRCPDARRPRGPVPVGSLGVANRFGLHDMIANVCELVEDPDRTPRPAGEQPPWPVFIRGGAWSQGADRARSTSAHPIDRATRANDIGFRLAIDADGPLRAELAAGLEADARWRPPRAASLGKK